MMFWIWNMMFCSLILLLSSHPFSFTSPHLKECWSLVHEDQLLLFDLGLNLPLSCLNWRMLQLFLGCNKCNITGCCIMSLSIPSWTSKAAPPPPCRFATRIAMLGLAVPRNWSCGQDRTRVGRPRRLPSTSFCHAGHHLTFSSLLSPLHPLCTLAKPRTSHQARSWAWDGRLEAAWAPFLSLATPIVYSFPLFASIIAVELMIADPKFTVITSPPPNSSCHHDRHDLQIIWAS
jgi:hypothetical protein